jgi:hypothetical protein
MTQWLMERIRLVEVKAKTAMTLSGADRPLCRLLKNPAAYPARGFSY